MDTLDVHAGQPRKRPEYAAPKEGTVSQKRSRDLPWLRWAEPIPSRRSGPSAWLRGETIDREREATLTTGSYSCLEDSTAIDATKESQLLVTLERIAALGAGQTFALLAGLVTWSCHSPEQLVRAITLALRLDLCSLAGELAQKGLRLFPEHAQVQRMARVFAPPVVRGMPPAPPSGLAASRAWLCDHASQYVGQWVAVRDGKLLGVANTLEELASAASEDPFSTIVAKVV